MIQFFQNGGYVLPTYMEEYVIGLELRLGKQWTYFTHFYVPMITSSHYFAIEIVFIEFTMYVYDYDHSCTILS